MPQPSGSKALHAERLCTQKGFDCMPFFKKKSQFVDRNQLLNFFVHTVSAPSTFLKMHKANLNVQNVILHVPAPHQCAQARGKGARPLQEHAGWVPVCCWHAQVSHMGTPATQPTARTVIWKIWHSWTWIPWCLMIPASRFRMALAGVRWLQPHGTAHEAPEGQQHPTRRFLGIWVNDTQQSP